MSRGKTLISEGDILRITPEGRGVAEGAGKSVLVAGALPGERVRYRRRRRHRNFDEAELLEVLTASPRRREARCAHYRLCGGCSLQHLAREDQLAMQQDALMETLARIGRVTPAELLPPLSGPEWGYRRRARLAARYVAGKGRVLVGFRERHSSFITDIERCEVLAEPVAALMPALGALVGALSLRERIPQVEVAVGDNRTALVFRVLSPPTEEDLAVLRSFATRHGLDVYLQPKGPDSATPLNEDAVELYYELPGHQVTIWFRPLDFVQVNGRLNALMVERVLDALQLGSGDRLLELFAGLGNFTLPAARRAAIVAAVEGDDALLQRARANAARNRIENVAFHQANLFDEAGGWPWMRERWQRLLLDPPRAGAAAICARAGSIGAERIVYVSCHPATLARDAGILVEEQGYRLSAAGVIDMFPHTGHVEAMAVFERR